VAGLYCVKAQPKICSSGSCRQHDHSFGGGEAFGGAGAMWIACSSESGLQFIRAERVGRLMGVLGQCGSLAHLDLSDNSIGDDGSGRLTGVLGQCELLADLDLIWTLAATGSQRQGLEFLTFWVTLGRTCYCSRGALQFQRSDRRGDRPKPMDDAISDDAPNDDDGLAAGL
jgi:hypothetical protein